MSQVAKTHVCPICKAKFGTAAALRMHRAAKHGAQQVGTPARNPRAAPPKRKGVPLVGNVRGANRVVAGSDLISSVLLSAPGVVGKRFVELHINPRNFPGTRLDSESKLWSRWRPAKLVVRIVPSAGALVSGMYTAGWVADSSERLGSGVSAVRKISTFVPNATSKLSVPMAMAIPCEASQKWYVFGSEHVDSTHGAFFVIQSAPIPNVTVGSQYTLNVYLDWTLEFQAPDLDTLTQDDSVQAASGWAKYFTTSISDWAEGKKLTLKHSAGGAAVPFPGIQHGIVYDLDPKAKLKYIKADGTNGLVKFGVAIPNYLSGLCMAVFDDAEKAEEFAKSGDNSHCLDYKAGGDWVVPDDPYWTPQAEKATFVARDGCSQYNYAPGAGEC